MLEVCNQIKMTTEENKLKLYVDILQPGDLIYCEFVKHSQREYFLVCSVTNCVMVYCFGSKKNVYICD